MNSSGRGARGGIDRAGRNNSTQSSSSGMCKCPFVLCTEEHNSELIFLFVLPFLFGCIPLDYGVTRGKPANKKENETLPVPTSSILGSIIVASNPNRRPTIPRLVLPTCYWIVFACFQKLYVDFVNGPLPYPVQVLRLLNF